MYFQRIGASGYALGKIKIAAAAASPAACGCAMPRSSTTCARRSTSASAPCCRAMRLDRLGADHRQARRHLDAGQRRDVHFKPRARAVDLRLSHGGGGRHRVLFHSRGARADPVARQPPSDQEMGGGRRRSLAAAFYLLLSGAEVATQRSFIMIAIVLVGVMVDRPTLTFRTLTVAALRRVAAGAGSGGASELPDVVCGDARADRRLSTRPAVARQRRHVARRARGAVGRARDRRAHPRVAGRRARHHALCRLSFPPRSRLTA